MKIDFTILNIIISLAALVSSEENGSTVNKRGVEGLGGGGGAVSEYVEVVKQVPVVHYKGVAVPVAHPVAVPVQVPIHVPEPVPVEVPLPIPIYRTVQIPVEKPVPVEVAKPYTVEVIEKVPVVVPKPYTVHVPVYRTKHIYHGDSYTGKQGW